MTRLALQHNAVNLAQGFPDFPAPQIVKDAAPPGHLPTTSISTRSPGARSVFATKSQRNIGEHYGLEFDPEREITVCCGSTEGMIASLLAVSNPGDEVIIFEPFYENFGPDTLLCDAHRKFVKLASS